MSIQTILLGGFHPFAEARGLNTKEDPETFGWIDESERFFYEDMRAAFDRVPGSREWMRSLKPGDTHDGPFERAICNEVTPNHSGASLSSLLGQYRHILCDWDSWVRTLKGLVIKRAYKKAQIDSDALSAFAEGLSYYGLSVDEGIAKHRVAFSDGSKPNLVSEVMALIKPILDELNEMKRQEDEEREKRRFAGRIKILEWNLKHPCRWFWPDEVNPRYSITGQEKAEMEKRHPGYNRHIDAICRELSLRGKECDPLSTEGFNNLKARLLAAGITEAVA